MATDIARDRLALDRLDRHGQESLDRMAARIDNLLGLISRFNRVEHKEACQRRRQQLKIFEVRLAHEMARVEARIERKLNPPPARRPKPQKERFYTTPRGARRW